MTAGYSVVVEPRVLRIAAEHMGHDPQGLALLFDAIDALAGESRPSEARAVGERRDHALASRRLALYEVDDAALTVIVAHLGRTEPA